METFKRKAQIWASSFSTVCLMDTRELQDSYSRFSWTLCAGEQNRFLSDDGLAAFELLQNFINTAPDHFIPGFLSYDLKNEVEIMHSHLPDHLGFGSAFFFLPETTLQARGDTVFIKGNRPDKILAEIEQQDATLPAFSFRGEIRPRMPRQDYRQAFEQVYKHIIRGDIYEMNLCQEFYSAQSPIDPLLAYIRLSEVSPTPFSCFLKYDNKYIISASPERFLQKDGKQLISQPIKGTARRYSVPEMDAESRKRLKESEKERRENIMIVDLVRHDLTKSAQPASVEVSELLGLQSFRQVHQLVSTIRCEANPNLQLTQILKNAFPPGSMTGAPKKRAMELIERYEKTRRGVYSGAVGYFHQGDFDFNVVIRSLLYNADTRYLSFQVGGAITAHSTEEEEYQECLLKAAAIQTLLKGN